MIINDRMLLAAFSGFIAALLANVTLYIINLTLPGPTINMPQLTVEIFLAVNNYTIIHEILGIIWSTVVGGTYALLYLIALDLTGWHYLWLKSIIVISAAWLLGAGFVMRMMELAVNTRHEPLSILAFFVAHLFFATYLYLLVNQYGKPGKAK